MRFRTRYVVRAENETTWAVYERHFQGEQLMARTEDLQKAHLIAAALEILPLTIKAMEDWDAGFHNSPKFEELKLLLQDISRARLSSAVHFESSSCLSRFFEVSKAVVIGILVIVVLAFMLSWLAQLL